MSSVGRSNSARAMLTMTGVILFSSVMARSQQAPRPATTASAITKPMAIAAYASTMTFNASISNSVKLVLKGNVTSSVIGSGTSGQSLTLLLCQDATGSRTLAFPANVRLAGGGLLLTKTPNKCDSVSMVFDGFSWYETSRALNFNP